MLLIFGLGNPGAEYESTRHNIGFMVVDRLAEKRKCKLSDFRFQSYIGETIIRGRPVLLAKPQTFMNCTGPAIRKICNAHGIEPADAMVICDDFNLPLGKLRFRRSGSDGGHNGLASVIEELKTNQFPRLRFGIGDFGRRKPMDFVLTDFTSAEEEEVEQAIEQAVQALNVWIATGIDNTMNRFNS
jgi:PTH1 family peptidyl-tRNA hydrolase